MGRKWTSRDEPDDDCAHSSVTIDRAQGAETCEDCGAENPRERAEDHHLAKARRRLPQAIEQKLEQWKVSRTMMAVALPSPRAAVRGGRGCEQHGADCARCNSTGQSPAGEGEK